MADVFKINGRRFAADVAIGLGLFTMAVIVISAGVSPAGAVGAQVLSFAESRWLPLSLIATMFSLFMAFNLALYRHVRRVYAAEHVAGRRSASRDQA